MVHRKTPKRKTHRRKHRGGYYGFSGAVGTGAPLWSRSSEMGGWAADVSSRAGNGGVQYGRGRKRTSKSKRSTRRKCAEAASSEAFQLPSKELENAALRIMAELRPAIM